MADNHPPLLAGLPHRLRERSEQLRLWADRCQTELRRNPRAFTRAVLVRAVLPATLVVGVFFAVRLLGVTVASALNGDSTPQAAPQATLYVACTNPRCRASYTTQVPISFNAWPLKCEQCGELTVYRAKRCPKCRHWYATAPGQPRRCPFCSRSHPAVRKRPQQTPPANPDDAEDPW